MKKQIQIVVYSFLSLMLLACLIWLFIRLDGGPDMVFPRKLAGSFIEQPNLVDVEGKKYIQWTIPVYCTRNGYEVQNVGYRSGDGGFWGGRDDAKCVPGNGGYQCRGEVLEDMLEENGEWIVQTSSHVCPKDAHFISESIMITVE